jgi:hypothetical protein
MGDLRSAITLVVASVRRLESPQLAQLRVLSFADMFWLAT